MSRGTRGAPHEAPAGMQTNTVREQQVTALRQAFGDRVWRDGDLVLLGKYDVTEHLGWHHELHGLDLADLIEHLEALLVEWARKESIACCAGCEECSTPVYRRVDGDDLN